MQWYYILAIVIAGTALLATLLWLFLIASKSGKALGRLSSVSYAHRGLHGTVGTYSTPSAENSLEAFSRAIEHGFGIELDVRLSKDGVLCVFHDDTLERVCGVKGRFDEYTADELSEFHLSGTECTIPTFDEVLRLVRGRVPLLVELKGESTDTAVADSTAQALENYSGEYIIESFNPLLLGRIKKLLPNSARGFLLAKHTNDINHRSIKYRIIQRCLLNFIARPHFLAVDRATPTLFPVGLLRTLFGTAHLIWTVRSQDQEDEAYASGCDAVIFENYLPKRGRSDEA